MHQFIASYLFQNKNCPLPGFGSLFIQTMGAEADFTNHLVTAPKQAIHFSDKEVNAANLLGYVAEKMNAKEEEALAALKNYCSKIRHEISIHAKAVLPGIGNFFVDENGNTLFEQEQLPAAFSEPVEAIRVIHPNAEHTMLVGDRETTNTLMTDYFLEEETIKDRWWIWALVLAALGLLLLVIHFSNANNGSFTGNAIKI